MNSTPMVTMNGSAVCVRVHPICSMKGFTNTLHA